MINSNITIKFIKNVDRYNILIKLGHNFAATHNEAYSWTESGTQVYSTMYASWIGDSLMKRRFSSNDGIHGDSTHNNIQHVQSTKSTVAGFQ